MEYYFQGDNKILTFPWEKGLNIDNINEYYDEYGFKDWTHKETGAPMLKMQHPEFELYSTGVHAQSGVACADCHMPYIREGATKVSDHWVRSPLTNVANACQSCHKMDEDKLKERILTIQNRTAKQLRETETAIIAAIDAINAAKAAGRDRRRSEGGVGLPTQGQHALGLHLVGEQHGLPQSAGSGARAGRCAELRAHGADCRRSA